MATSMSQGQTQGRTQIVSAILAEPESSLRSIIFASRQGLAVATKVDDAFPQQAAKVTINHDAFAPGDFVVRSVIAGSRRKFEILATDDQGVGLRCLLEMLPQQQQKFNGEALIEFDEGNCLVELPQAVIVAAFKGK
jgi:hypothetical protein